jgi:hypothetical protein
MLSALAFLGVFSKVFDKWLPGTPLALPLAMATDLTIMGPQRQGAPDPTSGLGRMPGATVGCILRRRFGPIVGRVALGSLFFLASVSAARAGTLTIAWDPSTDPNVAGYNVYWGRQSGVYNVGAIAAGPNTSVQITGLANGVTYHFVVLAYNSSGVFSPPSLEVSGRTNANGVWSSTPGDFYGRGHADLTVFRPSTGIWYAFEPQSGTASSAKWGQIGDIPVPGDYDGDGKTDLAVYRPSNGTWYINLSSTESTVVMSWGYSTDIPVPGDYDGDGKTDIAVFRPSDGVWYIWQSSTQSGVGLQWASAGDIPVPGDYDGDGKTDAAVFRPSTGTWYVRQSSSPLTPMSLQWGALGDVPVPADYDGDGKTDMAVFRPSNGTWYGVSSSTGGRGAIQWGRSTDIPAPADYDGDGKADVAVYRPSNGTWYVVPSSTGAAVSFAWGVVGDIPTIRP